MRRDEATALMEQKNALMVELRSIHGRGGDGPLADADQQRFDQLEQQIRQLDRQQQDARESELRELRNGDGAGGYQQVGRGEAARLSPMFDAYVRAGFEPDKPAVSLPYREFRSLTMTAAADTVAPDRQDSSVPLGFDQRYAYPAFPQVSVDATATSVQVLRQTARSLATAANVTRADRRRKREAGDQLDHRPDHGQLEAARHDSDERPEHLRHESGGGQRDRARSARCDQRWSGWAREYGAGSERLSGTRHGCPAALATQGSHHRSSQRLQPRHRDPDTGSRGRPRHLDDQRHREDVRLCRRRSGPARAYGMQTRISKTIPAPVVVDSRAFGKLYTGPVSLASFEADGGTTNRSNIRLEMSAAFGTERQAAAVRIAAS